MEELKPCPFCGGKAVMEKVIKRCVIQRHPAFEERLWDYPSSWIRVGCETKDCILYYDLEAKTAKLGFWAGCEREVIEKWNRRITDE